jgi:protein-S-isoprenylcysteine O-methyltransferase Ste14
MQPNPRVSYTLVALQFAALGILAITGPVIARTPIWFALEAAGLALGLWALWAMRRSPPNIIPDVRANATLVRAGPYRWIRHPMYTMLIVMGLAIVLNHPSALRWAVWTLLVAVLLVKIRYEERLLAAHFDEYKIYQQSTARVIPFLY